MKSLFVSTLSVGLVLALAIAAFGLSAAAMPEQPVSLAPIFGEYDLTSQEEVTVIVELTSVSMLEARHTGKTQSLGNLQAERNRIVRELRAHTASNVRVQREYSHVFSGMALSLPANALPQLAAISGVKAIYPNVEYTVDSSEFIIDSGEISPEMMNSAPHIGAWQVWAELGYTGAGITVAVIDTGVDYTHPDLAHAFGDYKGWDFVDNDDDPQETPPGDPRGGATNHGTHVAGTIAANGQIKGVAPNATLLAYRVLGPGGSGYTSDVVAGIERAVLDGADIMNLSLGNRLNDPDWATSLALDRAMAEGVVAVTSNGNAGPADWTVGSPGASRRAISVGATELPFDHFDVELFTSDDVVYPSAKMMGYTSVVDIEAVSGNTYEFVYAGLGFAEDFVGKDFTGKVALISRGAIPFVEKVQNAKAAGAVAAIIFNHVAGEIPFIIPGMALPTVKTTWEDGQKMLGELAAGNNQVTIDFTYSFTMPEQVADFSSRGPVIGTWMIKPDVVAPGVNITSTIPTHDPENPHGYAAFQGTSMASPHVAGAAALLLQAHPDWGVDEVKAALMNTAEMLVDPATGQPYPHNTQGAGSIRVRQAIEAGTMVIPGSYSFGHFDYDSGIQVERQHFEIKNLSDQRLRYSIAVEFAGNPEGIKVSTSSNLTVNPGRSQKVNMVVRVDTTKLDDGFYEGTIVISNGTEEVRVPTILFVGEIGLPLLGGAMVVPVEDGYTIDLYLPGGADQIYLSLYTLDLRFIADVMADENVPAGWNQYLWDRTAFGTPLPPGKYNLVVWVYRGDRIGGWVLAEVVIP